MTMAELMRKSDEELEELSLTIAARGNLKALGLIDEVLKFRNKRVVVVKGRKVPHGTQGVIFWMGCFDNSKYGDPWGIYTTVRIGIKDENGHVYWTSIDNIELVNVEA